MAFANFHRNPSLGADATGYAVDAGASGARVAVSGFSKPNVYQATCTTAGNVIIRYGANNAASGIWVSNDNRYEVIISLRVSAARSTNLIVDWINNSNGYITGTSAQSVTPTANTVTTFSGIVTAPANPSATVWVARAQITVQMSTAAVGETLQITGALFCPASGSIVTQYDDGDSSGWYWEGTQHSSVSRNNNPTAGTASPNADASALMGVY